MIYGLSLIQIEIALISIQFLFNIVVIQEYEKSNTIGKNSTYDNKWHWIDTHSTLLHFTNQVLN